MTWEVESDPARFEEAIEWFRARLPISEAAFYALEADARRRAFTVAAVAQMDLVNEVARAIDQALDEGETFADWQARVSDRLRAAWATEPGRVPNPGHRLETIFRTNAQLSYSAGRYRQMTEPAVMRARPMWMYDAILDSRTTDGCRELDGTIRPADDDYWQGKIPPRHFNCRSGLRTLRTSQAERRGGVTENPPQVTSDDGFGLAPDEREWEPDASEYPPDLWREYEDRVERRPE